MTGDDQDYKNLKEIREKYGPVFEAMKKTWALMSLEKGGNGDLNADLFSDPFGSYERFYKVQQVWGFFEAMLSIPEDTALRIIAEANKKE